MSKTMVKKASFLIVRSKEIILVFSAIALQEGNVERTRLELDEFHLMQDHTQLGDGDGDNREVPSGIESEHNYSHGKLNFFQHSAVVT